MADAAAKNGISPQTLRRYLFAAAWVDDIASLDADLSKSLQQAPMAAVEYVSRLYRRNQVEGLQVAKELAKGDKSVRSLAAISASRPAPTAEALRASSGRVLELNFRDLLLNAITTGTAEGSDLGTGHRFARVETDLPFDIEFETSNRQWRVLIVGPYRNHNTYKERCVDWCIRSLGLCFMSNRRTTVMLCLPEPSYLSLYNDTIARWAGHVHQLIIVALPSDGSLPDMWSALKLHLRP